MHHQIERHGPMVRYQNEGSFTRAEASGYGATKSYTATLPNELAAVVLNVGRDAPRLLAMLEHELGAGLALLANGLTGDSSQTYGNGSSPVTVTRAARKAAAAEMLTDLASMLEALTNAKNAL